MPRKWAIFFIYFSHPAGGLLVCVLHAGKKVKDTVQLRVKFLSSTQQTLTTASEVERKSLPTKISSNDLLLGSANGCCWLLNATVLEINNTDSSKSICHLMFEID